MIDIDMLPKMAKKIDFWQGQGVQNGYGIPEDVTKAWGYDEKGNLLFSTEYDKNGNFRISLFENNTGIICQSEDLYSDDLENVTLNQGQKQKLEKAKNFVGYLKEQRSSQRQSQNPSLNDLLLNGISVDLSDKSRLFFAPDIEKLNISKDKNGVLHMSGVSKDGKQQIDFSFKDGIAQFEFRDGEVARSYSNKIGGKWTWRDLKSPSGTRYVDNYAETYAKEMSVIMNKVKTQYQTRVQSNNYISGKSLQNTSRSL